MKTLIALLLSLTLLSGCAAIQDRNVSAKLAVQYTTLKVVEEDRLSKEGIKDVVEYTRSVINEDGRVDLNTLTSSVLSYIDIASMEPSRQLLILSLLEEIEAQIKTRSIDEAYIQSVNVLLDWIEQSLMLVND